MRTSVFSLISSILVTQSTKVDLSGNRNYDGCNGFRTQFQIDL